MKYCLAIVIALFLAVSGLTFQHPVRAQTAPSAADEEGYVPYVARQNPAGWNIPYVFQHDPADPAYAIALKAMAPTYKGRLDYNPRPLIGLAQVNLNRDPDVELIAFPTEEDEEEGRFCNLDGLCPHYVVEIADDRINTLGVLYGWKVNRGARIVNGYYTLQVFALPQQPDAFDEYAYNANIGEYRPVGR